jgi:ABC-2 type transport system ATP-binding protein
MFGRAVHVMVRNAAEARRQIADLLHSRGLQFEEIREIPPSLEDVFIARVHSEGGARDE